MLIRMLLIDFSCLLLVSRPDRDIVVIGRKNGSQGCSPTPATSTAIFSDKTISSFGAKLVLIPTYQLDYVGTVSPHSEQTND